MKLAKGAKSWILFSLFGGLLFLLISIFVSNIVIQNIFLFISTVFFLLAVFFLMFFRDPERNIGMGFVSVADGKIRDVQKFKDKDVGNCFFISTFMNVYNVHVNRMPIDGKVIDIVHISGSYIPAFKKESEKNERIAVKIDTKVGLVKIILIAGTLARRIVPYINQGDKLKKGDRIGIIRLGSRVDVYIPSKKVKKLSVKINDRVRAGEISLAEIND